MVKQIMVCFFTLLFLSVTAFAVNKGSAVIDLSGGKKGNITFPHKAHQEALTDCNVCHVSFPQSPGAIADEIAKGSLKAKQVMNQTCIKCHREQQSAGKAFGPVSCSGCHQK